MTIRYEKPLQVNRSLVRGKWSEMSSQGGSGASESKFEHTYDTNIVYHSHASNVPHLNSWIDELVTMTERGLPRRKFPTTQNLVDTLQRYDAVYRELLRQTSIFSEPVTKQLAKVWAGSLKLLDYMVKSYHRYVKHTSTIQEQAELLLAEKNNAMIASKVKEDEFDLEKTYLKAKIRNLEAEIDSMSATNREAEREISKLRDILNRYVNSEGMNTNIWDVINEDAENTPGTLASSMISQKEAGDMARHRLRELNRLDIEMNEVLTKSLKESDRQEKIMADIVGLLENNQEIFGEGSTSFEKSMRAEGNVLAWQAGVTKQIERADASVQVDEKEEYGVITNLVEEEEPEEITIAAPSVSTVPVVKGIEIPFQLRNQMSTYPRVLRIPPAAWVCQSIMAIYVDKIDRDKERLEARLPRRTLAEHVYGFYKDLLQLDVLADAQSAQLVKAVEHHMRGIRRVAIFASQMGMHDTEDYPSMDTRDTTFILSIIEHLMGQGELVTEKASRRKMTKEGVVVKSDILRASAIKTTEHLFRNWLPDGGQDYVVKIKSMNHSERGNKYVDVDEVIEILIEPWHTVRIGWEDHIRYLFDEHCLVHRVLSEYQFATDIGAKCKDTTLSQLNKHSAKECMRRPIRLFQKLKYQKMGEEGSSRKGAADAVQKEPVCESLNRKFFINTVMVVNPGISNQDAERMYEDAVEHAHRCALRDLETIWMRCTDKVEVPEPITHDMTRSSKDYAQVERRNVVEKRNYYMNIRTGLSQWIRPYMYNTFRANDIEYNSFAHVLMEYDVMSNSPLNELLHMTPKDLWPNADMFLKQIRKGLI